MQANTVLVLFLGISLSGCASTFTAFTDRSITSDHIGDNEYDKNKLKTQSGDRRLVRVVQTDNGKWLICAEPFAGALAARSAKSALTIAAQGDANDEFGTAVTAVDQRSEAVRFYQDAANVWCNLRASNMIDDATLVGKIEKLQDRVLDVLAQPAGESQ
jgi:hypothetical protein